LLNRSKPPADSVMVYATTYTESLALEAYLESLPHASPANFQTSIHPSGIEQALILNNRSVAALYPLAGSQNLINQALALALADKRNDVVIFAGEEAGTWLADLGVASDRSFAFALHLSLDEGDSIGKVSLTENSVKGIKDSCSCLLDFISILRKRERVDWTSGHGSFTISWT